MKVLRPHDRFHIVLPVHTETMKTTENAFMKRKVMVQGNFRDFWKETEFFRLRDFVNRLQSEEGLGNPGDNEYTSSVYARVFQENVNSEAEELLDLNGVSLEVLMVSDDEWTEGEQQLDLPPGGGHSRKFGVGVCR